MKYAITENGKIVSQPTEYNQARAAQKISAFAGTQVNLPVTLSAAIAVGRFTVHPVTEKVTTSPLWYQYLKPISQEIIQGVLVQTMEPVDLPAAVLASRMQQRISELHDLYEEGDMAWVRYQGKAFAADKAAYTNLLIVMQAFQTGQRTSIEWTGRTIPEKNAATGRYAPYASSERTSIQINSIEELGALGTAIGANLEYPRGTRAALEAQIAAAYDDVTESYDAEALKLIDVESAFIALRD